MSSDDLGFIKELTKWLEANTSRRERLLGTGIIKETTLEQILGGRYNPSEKLRTNVRAQMVVIDSEGQRIATG